MLLHDIPKEKASIWGVMWHGLFWEKKGSDCSVCGKISDWRNDHIQCASKVGAFTTNIFYCECYKCSNEDEILHISSEPIYHEDEDYEEYVCNNCAYATCPKPPG